ncbi:MAG: hypothetical protein QOC80_1210, partial [Frankiaceae bacterium]|nr:hypothetical protein [Frankiaceae bacterium]
GAQQLNATVATSGVSGRINYTLPGGADAAGAKPSAGTYLLTATFVPDAASAADWQQAAATVPLTVVKASQQLTFGALADTTFGAGPLALTAVPGGSGVPVTYASLGACTVTDSALVLAHAGTCAVTASEDGNSNWLPSASVTRSFTIARAAQAISFAAPAARTFGNAPFAVTAAGGGSGNPVTFTAAGAACSITPSGTVTVLAAGTCTLSAVQAGNGDFTDAPIVTRSLNVAKAPQPITFDLSGTRVLGSQPFLVSATAPSGLPVTFTAAGACQNVGRLVVLTGVGQCSVTAHQDGDANWAPASTVTRSVDVTYDVALAFDNTKAAKAGSTIPVKVYLQAQGDDISNPSIALTAVTLDGKPAAQTDASPPIGAFSYQGDRNGGGFYQFNLKTTGLSVGTHVLAYAISGDPQPHSLPIYIR